jgi:hypothetical protein
VENLAMFAPAVPGGGAVVRRPDPLIEERP